jgi:FemAB-related protein (PEP-CTERM system-associated)
VNASLQQSGPEADRAATLVRAAQPQDAERWNAFVRQHPEGTFFHLIEWREVLRQAFGHRSHYLLAERDGRVCGVLPLAHVRSRLFGNALVSTPFCVYGGIVSEDEVAHRALAEHACELARKLGVDYLELRNRRRQFADWPMKDLYVTFRKPIAADAGANMTAIPRKQRAMVRKGIQKGLTSEIDTDTARHYDLYTESLRNLGTPPFTRRYTQLLKKIFGSDCEILTVLHEGKPVASVLSFYFRDEVLPYYGGGSVLARPVAGNDFMYWQVMERARERGLGLFDYGRSKRGTGAFDFKVHWGFEPEPLFYEYYLVRARAVPEVNPTNPKYQRAIALWQRLPLWVTHFIGPFLARNLG